MRKIYNFKNWAPDAYPPRRSAIQIWPMVALPGYLPEVDITLVTVKIWVQNIWKDFAEIAGIDYVRIGKQTDLYQFKNELRWSEVYYR